MYGITARRIVLALSCLTLCLAVVPTAGAATVAANCAFLNGASTDIIIAPGIGAGAGKQSIGANDTLEVNCALDGRSVKIQAHAIVVNGPTGSIHTTGIAGMHLFAGLNSSNTKCSDPDPTTATIKINGATLQDDDNNGGIDLASCWDITFTAPSSAASAGDTISAQCLWPETPASPFVAPYGCQVKADGSSSPPRSTSTSSPRAT